MLQSGDYITIDFYDSGQGMIMAHGVFKSYETMNGEKCLQYDDYGVMYVSRAFVPMSNIIKIGVIDEETFRRIDGRMAGIRTKATDGTVVTKGGTREQWVSETNQYVRTSNIEVVSGGNDTKYKGYKTN